MLELPHNPRRGETFDIVIQDLTPKGLGRGWLEARIGGQKQGRRFEVLVRRALPGERVTIEVQRCRRGVVEGRRAAIVEPAPGRIAPRCGHFGPREEPGKGCGGCVLQSLSYADQLAIKERFVARCLAREGVDAEVSPIVAAVEPWYYRNKMEFSFGDDRERRFALGLYPAGWRREVLNLRECHLMSEGSARLVRWLSDWFAAQGLAPYKPSANAGFLRTLTVREGKRTGERMLELTTTAAEEAEFQGEQVSADAIAAAVAEAVAEVSEGLGVAVTSLYWTQHRAVRGERTRMISHLLSGSPTLREELNLPGGHTLSFAIHPRAFFQPNTGQAEVIYGMVVEAAGLRGAEAPPRVLDLYCGTGTIGLALSPYAAEVVGIELQPDAVENARQNAAHNGVENVTFHCGDVGEVLAREGLGAAGDCVVVDPPRAGLSAQALTLIGEMGLERLVYVSCNPRSLARDLAGLRAYGMAPTAVRPVDQFPHTMHVETVAVVERVSPA